MRVNKIACAASAALLVLGAGSPVQAQAVPQWEVALWFPNDQGTARFTGITAVSATDAWVIGDDGQVPTLEHFNGSTWGVVTNEVAAREGSGYTAVDATGPRNVWFFGHQGAQGLAEQWDGLRWRAHDLGTGRQVSDGKVLSADDVWVAGTQTGNVPYVGHYDGRHWTYRVTGVTVNAISASSPRDVWFAGSYQGRAALPHWDGTRYTRTIIPVVKAGTHSLNTVAKDVVAFKPNNVWAVGEASRVDPNTGTHGWPLTLHWDGHRWSVARFASEESLQSIAADGSGGLWSSGRQFMFRFTGGRWTKAELPDNGVQGIRITGLANPKGTTRIWAAATVDLDDPPEHPTSGAVYTYAK